MGETLDKYPEICCRHSCCTILKIRVETGFKWHVWTAFREFSAIYSNSFLDFWFISVYFYKFVEIPISEQ